MRRLLLALVLLLPLGPALAADWRTYVNDRFGTSVEIPADIFQPAESPQNGDGQDFVSRDGRGSIRVYAGANEAGLGLDQLYEVALQDVAGTRVTYSRKSRRWFVLSGYKGDDVYYVKLLLSPDRSVAHTLEILYPADLKRFFDPITARVANSLSAG